MFGSVKDSLAPLRDICEAYIEIEDCPDRPTETGAFVGGTEQKRYQRDKRLHACRPPRLKGLQSYGSLGWPIWECGRCGDIWMTWRTTTAYWHRLTPRPCLDFEETRGDRLSKEAYQAVRRALTYYRPRVKLQD